MSHQTVIVLDFGGQYNQLIARRVRECGVYCEVKPYTTPLADIRAMNPIGIIFTGGPNSVYDPKSPQVDPAIFTWGVPILGICYGCQLMAHNLGGRVTEAQDDSAREYGKTETYFDSACKLFKGLPAQGITWMSHGDYMEKVPEGFALVAHSDACPNVAICDESRGFYGVQSHPEVNHTEHGTDMIRNFLYEVCGAAGDWTMGDYKESSIKAIREKVGGGKVLLALSGGVDSSVAAALLAEAVGSQLTCVFVDHGLMRKNEGDEVETAFSKWDIHFVRVDAEARFLEKLSGVSESTVVRFASELGYDGYPSMQRALQEMIRSRLTSTQRIQAADNLFGGQDVLSAVIQSDMDKLRMVAEEADRTEFNKVVDLILGAGHLYILGVRTSSFVAGYLNFYLHLLSENVTLVQSNAAGEIFEQLLRIGPGDVMIAISFPRYSKVTMNTVKFAQDRGATIVAITDNELSPVYQMAEAALLAPSEMISFVDSMVAPLSLINALLIAVGSRMRSDVSRTFAELEDIWNAYGVFGKMDDE